MPPTTPPTRPAQTQTSGGDHPLPAEPAAKEPILKGALSVEQRRKLYDAISLDLKDRVVWEDRQKIWYAMRHDGLRRVKKPWPNAADMHFPLADMMIEKLKPFFHQQLFATDVLATFVSLNPANTQLATAVQEWFDYEIKLNSNLEDEALAFIDFMLMTGTGISKVFWDHETNSVGYDAVDPNYIIVPSYTSALQRVPYLIHVMTLSESEYREGQNYVQDDDFIDSITGRDSSFMHLKEDQKYAREGLTFPRTDSDEIVIWEMWHRNKAGKWIVYTFSPLRPEFDVRAPFENPFDHGMLPFIDFVAERKDKGYYSSRGIPEKVAPFETSLCKTWNDKLDAMTLYNRPLYSAPGARLPNSGNIELFPGQILPFKISPVIQPSPPISWDQEMIHTRMVAEQRVQIPDFGIGQQLNTSDRKTATEVNAISGLLANSMDSRSRLFRRSLGKLYLQSFLLLKQFKKETLIYIQAQHTHELNRDAIKGEYLVRPRGGADGVNKAFLMQKATIRMNMFRNDPFVNQVELRRSVMELDDPEMISSLLTDPNQKKMDEGEDQANELTYMVMGFPATVRASDDHDQHVIILIQFVQSQAQSGQPFNPVGMQRINQHIEEHLKMLAETNPGRARQLKALMKDLATKGRPDDTRLQVLQGVDPAGEANANAAAEAARNADPNFSNAAPQQSGTP